MSKRGENIFKRNDGRWEARYIHHYENGKAKYRYLYGHSYKEVKEKRLAELKQPENFKVTKIKWSACLDEIAYGWLEHSQHRVKESSYARYYSVVKNHIIPYFGNVPIVSVDTEMVEKFIIHLSESLAPKTINDILVIFKSIWHYGKEKGYPCRELEKIKTVSKDKRIDNKIISANDSKTIENYLNKAEDQSISLTTLGIIFTYFTGVRIGELCGLRWEDIDLNENTVRIRRTIQRVTDHSPNAKHKTKVIISTPKTENSERIIPLPQFMADFLKPFKQSDGFYLLTGKRRFLEPITWYRRYKTFLKHNNMNDSKFHALRHTFATHCVELGFDVKTLSEILGHSNISTTMNLYVHPTMKMKRDQMEKLLTDCSQNFSQCY